MPLCASWIQTQTVSTSQLRGTCTLRSPTFTDNASSPAPATVLPHPPEPMESEGGTSMCTQFTHAFVHTHLCTHTSLTLQCATGEVAVLPKVTSPSLLLLDPPLSEYDDWLNNVPYSVVPEDDVGRDESGQSSPPREADRPEELSPPREADRPEETSPPREADRPEETSPPREADRPEETSPPREPEESGGGKCTSHLVLGLVHAPHSMTCHQQIARALNLQRLRRVSCTPPMHLISHIYM